MASTSSEDSTITEPALIQMLEHGHELIIQLRLLLLQVTPDCLPELSWVMLDDVSQSLDLALSALKSWETPKEHRDAQAALSDGLTPSDHNRAPSMQKSWEKPKEHSAQAALSDGSPPADHNQLASSMRKSLEKPKEHRDQVALRDGSPSSDHTLKGTGSSKKRKRSRMAERDDDHNKRRHPYSRRTVTAAPYDDGYQWRKYGQKVIRGFKYPRSYFRCTYSTDEQRCPASKQVQQTDNDDPPRFLTVYKHEHTCKNGRIAPHVIVESTPTEQFSLSFVSRSTATPRQHLLSSESGEEQGNRKKILAKPNDYAHFSGSELMEAMAPFLMNTPNAETHPTATSPCPQTSETERWAYSLLGN